LVLSSGGEAKPSNVGIFLVDILTFHGFFGVKFDILKPRWLPTGRAHTLVGYRLDNGQGVFHPVVQFLQYESLKFFGAIASRSVSRGVLEKPSQSGVLQFKFEIACAHFRKTRELGH
jgi:hypothetical protein